MQGVGSSLRYKIGKISFKNVLGKKRRAIHSKVLFSKILESKILKIKKVFLQIITQGKIWYLK